MTKTMAIFGAGPALGMSIARRFGREGYELALVARDQQRLARHVAELADDGIAATAFGADFTDQASVLDAIGAIAAKLGPVNVAHYSASGVFGAIAQPLDIDVDNVSAQLNAALFTAINLARRVLPAMLDRGDGALTVSYGFSAAHPIAAFGNLGVVMGALRHYAHALGDALSSRGVYVGCLAIGTAIEGTPFAESAAGRQMRPISPDMLADRLWAMFTERDRREDIVPIEAWRQLTTGAGPLSDGSIDSMDSSDSSA